MEDPNAVLEHTLGLQWPWFVNRISFDDESPWARRRLKLTLPFEEMVVSLAREMPIGAVSRLVGEHDTRLRRVVNRHRE